MVCGAGGSGPVSVSFFTGASVTGASATEAGGEDWETFSGVAPDRRPLSGAPGCEMTGRFSDLVVSGTTPFCAAFFGDGLLLGREVRLDGRPWEPQVVFVGCVVALQYPGASFDNNFSRKVCNLWSFSALKCTRFSPRSVGEHMPQDSGFWQDTKWYSRCLTFRHQGKGQTSKFEVVPGQSRTWSIIHFTLRHVSR